MQSADGGFMNKEEYQEERQKILDGCRNKEYISAKAIRKLHALEFEYLNSKGKRRKANGNKSE